MIHNNPVHQLTFCEVKSCVFVISKAIFKIITSKKCMSSIHNIAFSSENVISSEPGEKYAQIKNCLYTKTVTQNLFKQIHWFILMWKDNIHWRKCFYWLFTYILARSKTFVLKCLDDDGFVLTSPHKALTDGLDCCGSLVDDCVVFISCLDSHSDGTHSLQSILWWATGVMLHFSTSVLMEKQTDLHLSWPEGEYFLS